MLAERLAGRPFDSSSIRHSGSGNLRFGHVSVHREPASAPGEPPPSRPSNYGLQEECQAIHWVHDEVSRSGRLPLLEAEVIVQSLSVAMHAERASVLPLLQLKEFDQYTTTHSMNVAVLAMALGETLELGSAQVRAVGVAGLLHDLGKVQGIQGGAAEAGQADRRRSGRKSSAIPRKGPEFYSPAISRWIWPRSSPTSTT